MWHRFHDGVTEIGYPIDSTNCLDFCFDNETPRHKVYLEAFGIANRSVTCREYLEFMSDDAYARPEFWLSEGWEAVRKQGWRAPLYWERDATDSTGWRIFTLRGWHPLSALLDTPVCHVSFFEADAFARWRGCRLPTKRNGNLPRMEVRFTGTCSTPEGYIPQSRPAMALTNSSGTAGSGQQAPTRAIRVTSPFLAPWANTTANLCPAR